MRTALITGSGRREGLGFETARQLAAEGFHVILAARKLSQVDPLAAELAEEGFDASALELDLLTRPAWRRPRGRSRSGSAVSTS